MFQLLQLYGNWQGFQGRFGRMPAWARFLVGLAALPGIVLILLSILAFVVSLAALFLLTVPVYRAVSWLSGFAPARYPESGGEPDHLASPPPGVEVMVDAGQSVAVEMPRDDSAPRPPRRQIEVKIVE